jgi:hypothetical protein
MIRVAATGVPFTVCAESLAIILLRGGQVARIQAVDGRGAGKHRTVIGNVLMPTIVVASGVAIDALREHGGRVIAEYDPVDPSEREEARRLRDLLQPQFTQSKREDLVDALINAEHWLPLVAPKTVDRMQLKRYLRLASGDARRAYAAFFFEPNTPW